MKNADSPGNPGQTTSKRWELIENSLICPSCRTKLTLGHCRECRSQVQQIDGQYRFVHAKIGTGDAAFQNATHNGSSFTGRAFNLGRAILSSEFQPHNHLKSFLEASRGTIVELGSGARRLAPEIINIDLFPSKEVDIVADIAEVPLCDSCADAVIIDSVIEHVPYPDKVVAEAHRILKPGGRLFINCPFMLPYHGYPAHFRNLTRDGMEHLLEDFDNVEIVPTFGPMTALVNMFAETFAVIVGGSRGFCYVAAKGIALLPTFWLKYLDYFFITLERSHRIAGMLCAQATKSRD